MKKIINIEKLNVSLFDARGYIKVAEDLDLELFEGEILGFVGESGSGKTTTALSLTNLLPHGSKIDFSNFSFCGKNYTTSDLSYLRARGIAYIFQEPISYINPLICIGKQIQECIEVNSQTTPREVKLKTLKILEEVGLNPAEKFYFRYSHELSGGMCQRAMIAMAISCNPKVLIADEPTTALDAATERSIIQLIRDLVKKNGLSIIWITHDISLIRSFSDRLAVMYSASIVEEGETESVYDKPMHPYTKNLLDCLPENYSPVCRTHLLNNYSGFTDRGGGCPFYKRCSVSKKVCAEKIPDKIKINHKHSAKCFLLPKN